MMAGQIHEQGDSGEGDYEEDGAGAAGDPMDRETLGEGGEEAEGKDRVGSGGR